METLAPMYLKGADGKNLIMKKPNLRLKRTRRAKSDVYTPIN